MDPKLPKDLLTSFYNSNEQDSYENEKLLNNNFSNNNSKKSKDFKKTIDIFNLNILPNFYFAILLIVFLSVIFNSLPIFLKAVLGDKQLYQIKSEIQYFSYFYSKQSEILQLLIVVSQIIFFLLSFLLCSLINQRISVPELKGEKSKNLILLIVSLISLISILGITFFSSITISFSKNVLFLVEDVGFLTYLISSFIFCLISYHFLVKIEINGIPKNITYLTVKLISVYFMGFALILYTTSLVLVSYYDPIIEIERLVMNYIILNKEIDVYVFISSYLIYVLSLKYDLHYVHLNLQIKPDLEYFVDNDQEENYKSIF